MMCPLDSGIVFICLLTAQVMLQVSLFVLISIMSRFKSSTAEVVRGLNNWLWSHSVV